MAISLDGPDHGKPLNIRRLTAYAAATILAMGVVGSTIVCTRGPKTTHDGNHNKDPGLECVQAAPLIPDFGNLRDTSYFTTPSYLKKSVDLLSGAIQIPTESFDDMTMDPADDPRFKIFGKLHEYIFDKFPLSSVFAETVKTYGLLYTIEGSDPSLKPIVLMSHQDVVPVNPDTIEDWDYGAFSGHFDGEWLHGRGAADTKNTLVAILEAVEALLEQGWNPKRTILLSFGCDEEIYGTRSAKYLADTIYDRYGYHGVEAIIDEGLGIGSEQGTYWAKVAVAEKGRADYRITVDTPGGHSSMPPDHTGIGIMSQLVTSLEDDPFHPATEQGEGTDVVFASFACLGHHAASLDKTHRELYTNLDYPQFRQVLIDELADDATSRVLVQTTQAIDTILGGVKLNALPEKVTMEMNHRISPDSSVNETSQRILSHVERIAEIHDLAVWFDGDHVAGDISSRGNITIETSGLLEPAPVSPYHDDAIWEAISGATKHVVQQVLHIPDTVMAPYLMTGNTDTAHYWNVSSHIYRYMVALIEDTMGVHTINERIRMRSHISCLAWFYEFLITQSS